MTDELRKALDEAENSEPSSSWTWAEFEITIGKYRKALDLAIAEIEEKDKAIQDCIVLDYPKLLKSKDTEWYKRGLRILALETAMMKAIEYNEQWGEDSSQGMTVILQTALDKESPNA